ncbi:LAETG motif-containing sortase-dependent surface protein [Streptomyces sp. NPDC002328]|uniref:LAETG motif-containing sortase-dependent surface protein n=1 Tax=Streptomyces sp. NPDC002328 TaxID=3364642 RepID=UPI00369BFE9A
MSSARRPLLTATAAGTLLGALWFVPNANATQDGPARTDVTTHATTQARAANARAASARSDASTASAASDASTSASTDASGDASTGATASDDGARLADTGSFDTTPYVVGGTALLALGAGFVVYSVRRERLGF